MSQQINRGPRSWEDNLKENEKINTLKMVKRIRKSTAILKKEEDYYQRKADWIRKQ